MPPMCVFVSKLRNARERPRKVRLQLRFERRHFPIHRNRKSCAREKRISRQHQTAPHPRKHNYARQYHRPHQLPFYLGSVAPQRPRLQNGYRPPRGGEDQAPNLKRDGERKEQHGNRQARGGGTTGSRGPAGGCRSESEGEAGEQRVGNEPANGLRAIETGVVVFAKSGAGKRDDGGSKGEEKKS